MDCNNIYPDKQTVSITLHRDALIDDIRNCAYIEGESLADGQPRVRALVQDICEEGNEDRITRILDLEVAACRELLLPYTQCPVEQTEADNRFSEQPLYGIVMQLPVTFSQTTLNHMEKLIHEYLVSRSLSEWLGMALPEKAGAWEAKARRLAEELAATLNRRRGRIRRNTHPF